MIFDSRRIRDDLGMTQQEFAILIGDVSIATVQNWDTHRTVPQPLIRPRLRALLKELGYEGEITFEEVTEAETINTGRG